MPSFQSPVPKSGRPCAPAVMPRSMARRQCSNSVPSSRGHGRRPVGLVLVGRERRRLRGTARARRARRRRRSSRTYSATTYGSQSRSSEQRVRSPRPVGSCHQCCTSPSTNCRAGGAQQVLAREVRPRERQRHHVLQLIAEAVRRRPAGSSRRASRAGSSRPGRAASDSSAHRTNRPACAPGWSSSMSSHDASHRARAPLRGRRRGRAARSAARAWSRSVALAEQEDAGAGVSPGCEHAARRAAPRTDRGRRRHWPESAVVAQRGRPRQVAVAADERAAIAGGRRGGSLAYDEGDVAARTPGCRRCCAKMAPVRSSSSVTTCRCSPSRGGPSTHSL